MKILVTGTAGFIGFHLAQRLLERGDEVVGLDNINNYYDVNLKYARLTKTGIQSENGQPIPPSAGQKNQYREIAYGEMMQSSSFADYRFIRLNLEDRENVLKLFNDEKFDKVCHLAAQAGVRYSLENPFTYIESNIVGFVNILEGCRHNGVKHLAYASSSSVYGNNTKMPLSTSDSVDHPISLYAASKKSNELMAHTYSHLFGIPTTGLRFFTVYGPWGRPDMALFMFAKAILEGKPIQVFNNGNMVRDFTYVDDIVEGVIRVIDSPPSKSENLTTSDNDHPDPSISPTAPYKVYNIGNSNPVKLLDFIDAIEKNTGNQAIKQMMPIQPGDVQMTFADVHDLVENLGYRPNTPIFDGVRNFVKWYRGYYG